jgi:hypothetical protein
MSAVPPLYRLTVDKYQRMVQVGILDENDRVELIEGLLIAKRKKSPRDATTLCLLGTALAKMLPEDKVMRNQSAVTLSDSVPEPDLAIAEGPARRYIAVRPGPGDLHLVVEVAESSLQIDRADKLRIYARARIPVYWIANLVDNQVEVYTQPRAGRTPTYLQRQDYGPDEDVPVLIEGREVARLSVRDFLP